MYYRIVFHVILVSFNILYLIFIGYLSSESISYSDKIKLFNPANVFIITDVIEQNNISQY